MAFEQIGKDLNELKREKALLNTDENQKNKRESLFDEEDVILHSKINNN